MQTANDAILHSLGLSQTLMRWYTTDLTPLEYLHRPVAKANCAAWLIGHLVLIERGVLLDSFDINDLPPLPDGFEKRFGRDEGSPQAGEFGDVMILMPLFNQTRQRTIEVVQHAAPEQLSRRVDNPLPVATTAGEMANFVAMHAIMHAGQISIIRRSLGRAPVM